MTSISTQRGIVQFICQPGFILAAINFSVGLVWIAVIQPLDAPDEVGHLQAIMQVRKQHILPEIHYVPGNAAGEIAGPQSDPETRAYIAKVSPNLPVYEQYFPFPYESFQPPLYYLVAGLLTQLVPPDPQTILYISRVLAVLLGAASVYFCWLGTRELAPQAPMLATASAGVVALLPQFCFNSAHASNDSMIQLTATAAFYVWIRGLRHPDFDRWLLGAGGMLGLALLSKLTAVALIPGLALVVLFRILQVRPSFIGLRNWVKRAIGMILGATAGTALVCGWWFVRNIFTYGEPSGTNVALRFFARKFIKANFSLPRTARDLLRYTLESLWGRFGWNDITLPQQVYQFCNSAALVLVGLSVLVGLGAFGLCVLRGRLPFVALQAFLVFLVIGMTLFAAYLQFNKSVGYQPQARYFFILALPGSLLLTGGLYTFAAIREVRLAVLSILFIGLTVLNALALVTVIKAGVATAGVRQNLQSTNPQAR